MRDLTVDGSNRIVVVVENLSGEMQLVRYHPNGLRDMDFGTDGFSQQTGFGGGAQPQTMTLAPNGSILVAGKSTNDVAVARWIG
jgi:hypothetical protein